MSLVNAFARFHWRNSYLGDLNMKRKMKRKYDEKSKGTKSVFNE